MSTETESEFVSWARSELKRAGLFDEDSDYEGMLGESVMELVLKFSEAGHSGFSAAMAGSIFSLLVDRKPLTPLTNDPDEWMNVSDLSGSQLWQSRRMASAFSEDGGKTYHAIDEPQARWRNLIGRVLGRNFPKTHRTKKAT